MATYGSVLAALQDPTRRTLFERLRQGPTPVAVLARQVTVSRPAVSQHLRVLSEAGLITRRRVGTRHLYTQDPVGLEPLRAYVDSHWNRALIRFKEIADAAEQEGGNEVAQTRVDLTIRKAVTVKLPQDGAFALFTEGIASWWPFKTKSVGEDRAASVVLEGFAGGRLFELMAGGGQALWGQVQIWDPPQRIVIAWHVNVDDPSTIIEVSFEPTADGTRVQLEHRGWEKYGQSAAEYSREYSVGWDTIFVTHYKKAADAN